MDRKYSRQIDIDTLKSLLARSGNQCAFPDCVHPLFDDNNLFIAQLCHIEGVSPKGERHNSDKTDEETNSYDNLLFFCYRHHIETDNVDKYPVQKLKEIKAAHEAKFKEATYKYSNQVLDALIKETTSYWQTVEELHKKHIVPELRVPIDTNQDILSLISDIDDNMARLHEVNAALMSSRGDKNFEYICLALPNYLTRINVALDQIEIKYIEELQLKYPDNKELLKKLDYLRERFKNTAQRAGLAD